MYVIQHPEKLSQTLRSCARQKFVSCTSNWLRQMLLLPKNTRHLLRLTLSPQDLQQSLSLETNPVCHAVPFQTGQYSRKSHNAWVHFVTDLASLLTDHKMSGRPIRAKYKHLKTICEQISDNSPPDSSSSCLNWWSSRQGLETFYNCSVFFFFLPIRSIAQRIFEHVPPCRRTTLLFVREVFATPVIFLLLQQKHVTQTSS